MGEVGRASNAVMAMRTLRYLRRSTDASVAPTVALSLVGLLAAGGLAFDYSRMAALDTELQTAADQAALAAATQLDGGSNARARGTAAASSLLRNISLFADATNAPNGDARRLSVPTVAYYQSYDAATDTPGAAATSDANAKVVIVTVGARRAAFAFTPIVGRLNSGDINAQAVATLSSAICKVPPLMICAPNNDFPQSGDVGKGVLLEPGGGGAWVPGNYGYLDFGNGASGVKINLGSNNDASVCRDNDTGTPTEPGNQASVTAFLNTRFDLYAPSVTACNAGTGDYCPAQNTRKDMTRIEEVQIDVASGDPEPANPGCGAAGATTKSDFQWDSATPNFPRDDNQATCTTNDNSCPKFGSGAWGRDAYVGATHPTTSTATIAAAMGKTAATLTRWDVYRWELADSASRMPSQLVTTSKEFKEKGKSGNGTWTFTNKCSYPFPKNATAVVPGAVQKDRRLLTVAVVNCNGENGKFSAHVLRFADMFLVQPSLDRGASTGKDQIYVEVVRVAEKANGQSAFQYYLRQRPRLIK